jgi:hypothetical protein
MPNPVRTFTNISPETKGGVGGAPFAAAAHSRLAAKNSNPNSFVLFFIFRSMLMLSKFIQRARAALSCGCRLSNPVLFIRS